VELFVLNNGELKSQGTPQNFKVKPVNEVAPADLKAIASFQEQTSELYRQISGANRKLSEASKKLRFIKTALKETAKASPELFATMNTLDKGLADLRMQLTGDRTRQQMNESTIPSIMSRVGNVIYGHWSTTQLPTETQKRNIKIAESGFKTFQPSSEAFFRDLASYENALENAGAPWTPNRGGE
jgi:chromosome segregation ATPase